MNCQVIARTRGVRSVKDFFYSDNKIAKKSQITEVLGVF
jgi:hypothetical protein